MALGEMIKSVRMLLYLVLFSMTSSASGKSNLSVFLGYHQPLLDVEVSDQGEKNGQGEKNEQAQQELEQWLRRVPDDPGGLLREKFRYQSRMRAFEQQRRPSPPGSRQQERW